MNVRPQLAAILLSLAAVGCSESSDPHGSAGAPQAGGTRAASQPRGGRAASPEVLRGSDRFDFGGGGLFGTPEALPKVSKPEVLGMLVGPQRKAAPEGVEFYGTDMGLTVEHQGELYILFGDTWADSQTVCDPAPPNDDTIGILPRSWTGTGQLPQVRFLTDAEQPQTLSRTSVYRDQVDLPLGFGRAPVAAFSDGERSFAVIQRLEPTPCDAPWANAGETCPTLDQFSCTEPLGTCQPDAFPLTYICDPNQPDSCLPDQTCVPQKLCVDPTGSQYQDGSFEARNYSIAHALEISAARSDSPSTYDSLFTWTTNKFAMPAVRTVEHFSGKKSGSDYRPGHGTLLYWGRPNFLAEHGREAHLYLMSHDLPFGVDAQGKLEFAPKYFSGVDPVTGEPVWSPLQSRAKAIALDGQVDGSPHEVMQMVGMYGVSWLGAPINKWVMLYSGDLPDWFMLNPEATRASRAPGAVHLRFADHPWGPFSPPVPHLVPGSPLRNGDPYGPGGFLHHPQCVDSGDQACAPSDPRRPPDSALPGCPRTIDDPGRLYQANIIDNYTQPNADGGLDVYWNISTWNPYGVQLVKTSFYPPTHDTGERSVEPADREALERMSSWRTLPELGAVHRYVQQSSRDRGVGSDARLPLSERGNRDFNNFVCAGPDAVLNRSSRETLHFDEEICEETYVRGAVLARFEGSGHMARLWLGANSLMNGPADDEVLRIYVDDDPRPKVDAPLAEALDGRAGEIFAPPFGAGSSQRLSWYYPVAFRKKLIVALDHIDGRDFYNYQVDAVLDSQPAFEPLPESRLFQRDVAARQLSDKFHPAGLQPLLHEPIEVALEAERTQSVQLTGPSTIQELRVRFPEADLPRMAAVDIRIAWDGAAAAIELPLLDLLGGSVPPDHTSHALTSYFEGSDRVLALKLPMPFERTADVTFHNRGDAAVRFELRLNGERGVPAGSFGKLHVQPRETVGPTSEPVHEAASASGRGRLVGVCGRLEGHADVSAGFQRDHLNFLEGDVHAVVDSEQALDGTGTEDYADAGRYYATAPHASPFAQAWGVESGMYPPARASFCRWHVLGTELDFERSFSLTFELGGQQNPWVVDRYRTVAYLYLAP